MYNHIACVYAMTKFLEYFEEGKNETSMT